MLFLLQADFGVAKTIVHIATKGRYEYPQWVTSYKFAYGLTDVEPYTFILDPAGDEMVFDGNTDQDTAVTHELETSVRACYVRLYPQTWYGHMSLRWEVYSCECC